MPVEPAEMLDALSFVHDYYSSAAGLQRANGLAINGRPDFEGVATWVLDVFLNSRLDGLDLDACQQNVMHGIQQTQEWRAKHPGAAGTAVPRPFRRVVPIDRSEFLRTLHRLDVFYKSWNGLQRPNGLSRNGAPDFEGIAAWVFGSYLNSRLAGRAPEESWDQVIAQIASSVEWRTRERPPVDSSTLTGKHLAGYQGWFGTPDDGQNNGWDHWFGGAPAVANVNFDFWPDTRECFESELAPTAMTMRDGSRARLYSCHNPRTLRRHFDWMADAGIDGVSLGRFIAGTRHQPTRRRLDHLLTNMNDAAGATGRVYFVWYDVTDSPHHSFVADMKEDWRHIAEGLRVTQSSSYLKHNGRPLVGIWGAGAEGRPQSTADWREVIRFMKSHGAGATVLLGGTRDWRDNPVWAPIFAEADVVSPWAITAFHDDASADAYRRDVLEPDLAMTRSRGQIYLPTLFPGFSWHNLQRGAHPPNGIRRRGGRFYWRQAFNAIDAGVTCLFTAMFDEVDEGTAILKIVETQRDVPAEGTFLSMDSEGEPLPSDWYLRLAGAAGSMLRGETQRSPDIPIAP